MRKVLKKEIRKLDKTNPANPEVIGRMGAGTAVEVSFDDNGYMIVEGTNELTIGYGYGRPLSIKCRAARYIHYFGGRVPSEKTLEKWVDEGWARTITGHKTEPDGNGPDGSPSWLIVLGLI